MTSLDSSPAIVVASSKAESPAGPQTDRGQDPSDAHKLSAPVADLRTSQDNNDTQQALAGAEQYRKDRLLADGMLNLRAAALDDIERVRIASENRLRSLQTVYGLTGTPEEAQAASLVDGLKALDHQADLDLRRALRKHPLGGWVKSTLGIGERQGARLLAAIGDPYIRPEIHRADGTVEPCRPRTVSELLAYCGLHVLHPTGQGSLGDHRLSAGGVNQADASSQDGHGAHTPTAAGVAPSKTRGNAVNWNTAARTRAWLVAESCIRVRRSPYRLVYEVGREKYAGAVHTTACRQCGPKGKPAAIGSPLSKGHQKARAQRLVMREVVKDLWRVSRDLHHADAAM